MRMKKKYGSYQELKCPFCESRAITKSKEKIPVCPKHKNQKLPPLRCFCKNYVNLMDGKHGPFFLCVKCGNLAFERIIEINVI